MPVNSFNWDESAISRLSDLWRTGLSASRIAETLGPGATKNAVIGKARRVGLPPRPSPLGGAAARAHFSDPQQLEALKRLKEMGHSCLSISRALHIPKDAVANKLSQLGLHTIKQTPNKSWRNSTLRALPSEEGNVQQASMLDQLKLAAPVVPMPRVAHNATCQWVTKLGGGSPCFCDKPAVLIQTNGKASARSGVWCEKHYALCYRPASTSEHDQEKAA